MQLKLQSFPKNTYPISAFLIKNSSLQAWITELQCLGFSLSEVEIFPIPDITANSVWGCFVLTNKAIDTKKIGKNEVCQTVSSHLFIAEKTILYPFVTQADISALFPKGKHLAHPEFGWVELSEALNFSDFLLPSIIKKHDVLATAPTIYIPQTLRSFQILPVSPEEVLENMEAEFPQQNPTSEAPLSIFEKAKLGFYKMLMQPFTDENGQISFQKTEENDSFLGKIGQKFQQFFDKNNKIGNKIIQDLAELERRNQKQADKLLDLFRTNPDEALKYAIPLDSEGTGRGGNAGTFELSQNWGGGLSWLSSMLSSNTANNAGGGINFGNQYFQDLHAQYTETARDLIQRKEYQKAAFVYMKLLKNSFLAAQTLEDGQFYQEAATIYLKHCSNKSKAAECYEAGKMTTRAIELYKELDETEKVGDLYLTIGKREEAHIYFEKRIETYKNNHQYVKASLIYRNKMQEPLRSQSLLLEGWKGHKDAENCLNNYFTNIPDTKALGTEIQRVYQHDVPQNLRNAFLEVIKKEYKKQNELAPDLRQIAYELIATQAVDNQHAISELKHFNEADKAIVKDIVRYRVQRNRTTTPSSSA